MKIRIKLFEEFKYRFFSSNFIFGRNRYNTISLILSENQKSSFCYNFNFQSKNRIYYNSSIYNYSILKMVESDKLLNADDVKTFLEKNGVTGHIQKHEPVLTCNEHVKVICTEKIEGQFIKNLIMKTKSGKFIYYMASAEGKTDFKGIEKFTGEKNVRGADENV